MKEKKRAPKKQGQSVPSEGRATCGEPLFQPAALQPHSEWALRSPCRAAEAPFAWLSTMAFHNCSTSSPDFSFLEVPLSIAGPSYGFQATERKIISEDRSEYLYSVK